MSSGDVRDISMNAMKWKARQKIMEREVEKLKLTKKMIGLGMGQAGK